ncbi:imidazole glycerol phosphate synthase subunit HisF [Enterococcus devriesei]|uniref:imidazole glycerol phosphate synthase subunit HisF n=1 Tax=Enterococcus devriesei TaxID=319970 RepID=UPI001C0FEF0E|nr:imidazole glycerol phosphate synthase subunit HisF [Enterococcus devriesei]MBU5365021.1 imidazole glycerol phosphate synthase subunit HisF [Enterococcus devriesei]MDT2821446.1 imidazole glycerol phosphate synthase subunit HisF [Enterococcus devriesei]
MIAKRIVPCLDVRAGRVVKGINFAGLKDVNDPVTLARFYNEQGADELVFYDITASAEGRGLFTDILKGVASEVFIPLTVGGGINEVSDFERVLNCGADKVSVNSGAIRRPQLIEEGAKRYGSQCVVLSVDIRRVGDQWHVFAKGGREDTGLEALEWIRQGEQLGAGELVLNSMDTDGVKQGFDLELLQAVSEITALPIVASGGAGNSQDFIDLFQLPKIEAGLAASIFHYGEVKIPDLKQELLAANIPVRIV